MPKKKKEQEENIEATEIIKELKYTRYFVKNAKYKSSTNKDGLKRVNFLNSTRYELEYIRLCFNQSRHHKTMPVNQSVIYRPIGEYGLISSEHIVKIQKFLIDQINNVTTQEALELNLVDMLHQEFSESLDEFAANLRPFYIAPIQDLDLELKEQTETINNKKFCFSNYIFSNLSAKHTVRAKIARIRLDTIKGYRQKLFEAKGALADDIKKLRIDHDKTLWSPYEESKPIDNEDIVMIITLEKP